MKTWECVRMYLLGSMVALVVLFKLLKDVWVKGYSKVLGRRTYPRPDETLDDPQLGTHGYLRLDTGVRIHYVASGPEDKPLMLFLHGFPDFWFSWRHQIKEFKKDYRVVAIDQRGYGDSDRPSGVGSYMTRDLVQDVRHVIEGLGYSSCVLVGYDWGGLVAWTFAHYFPDMVDRLVVLNAPAWPVFKECLDNDPKQAKMSMYIFFFQIPFIPELSSRLMDYAFVEIIGGLIVNPNSGELANKSPWSPEEIAAYKYTFSRPGALKAAINWYRAGMGRGGLKDHSLDYPMPCLLLWGLKDTALCPRLPDMMEARVPNIVVKRRDDLGHFTHLEEPEWVNRELREWLEARQ